MMEKSSCKHTGWNMSCQVQEAMERQACATTAGRCDGGGTTSPCQKRVLLRTSTTRNKKGRLVATEPSAIAAGDAPYASAGSKLTA
jgi:hypothetical protein